MLLKGASPVIDEHGQVDAHCFQIGDEPRASASATLEHLPAKFADAVVFGPPGPENRPIRLSPQKSSEALSTRKLLTQLRARLRDINREIATRKKLEAERDQIRRLISAAEAERNNVRRIRAAG